MPVQASQWLSLKIIRKRLTWRQILITLEERPIHEGDITRSLRMSVKVALELHVIQRRVDTIHLVITLLLLCVGACGLRCGGVYNSIVETWEGLEEVGEPEICLAVSLMRLKGAGSSSHRSP